MHISQHLSGHLSLFVSGPHLLQHSLQVLIQLPFNIFLVSLTKWNLYLRVYRSQLTIILSLSWIFFLLPILLLVTKFVFLYSSTMLAWSINMNQKALYHLGHSPNLLWICEGFVYLRNPTFNIPINPTQTTLIEIDVLQNAKSEAAICHSLYIIGAKQAQAQLFSQWNFVVTISTNNPEPINV